MYICDGFTFLLSGSNVAEEDETRKASSAGCGCYSEVLPGLASSETIRL